MTVYAQVTNPALWDTPVILRVQEYGGIPSISAVGVVVEQHGSAGTLYPWYAVELVGDPQWRDPLDRHPGDVLILTENGSEWRVLVVHQYPGRFDRHSAIYEVESLRTGRQKRIGSEEFRVN